MKLHARYQLVARARNDLSYFVLAQMEDRGITAVEMVGNLLSVMQEQQKFLLRLERHGDGDKKADEA